jgi:hypothetical protein
MKKAIFCVVVCFLNLPAVAINYDDFPPNLQRILDERANELTAGGGICVVGRVTMDDGAPIRNGKDVKVNFLLRADIPLWLYDGGWFIMDRTFQPGPNPYSEPARLMLRAFGYDPIDVSTAVPQGQITYVEFVMHKTPTEKLASITGIVTDEQDKPFADANVSLSFPFSSHGTNNEPHLSIATGSDGRYLFEGLSTTEHSLSAFASGCAYHSVTFTPPAGGTATKNLKLYQNRKIIIDYVYQADGSRNFAGEKLRTGTLEWVNGHEGVDFSDGRVEEYEPNSLRDIEMRQDQGELKFQNSYVNGNNGFYDAGAVGFDTVVEAAEKGYNTRQKPCVAGHVYVVRTYEGHYAKFIVKEIGIQ